MNVSLPVKPSSGLSGFGVTKTQQHLAKYSDVNYMIQRALSGDSSVFRSGQYMDISECPDAMQEFLNTQRRAVEAYELLPASVRARYTTPEAFFAAANDANSRAEFARLGLLINRGEDKAIKVEVINPVTAKADEPSTGSACA